MAVVTLEQCPKKVKDLFNRASTAIERDNADYAIEMLLSTLDLEPQLLQARRLLRMAEIRKATSGKSSMSGLKGMGPKSKIKSLIKKDPAKALKTAEEQLMTVDPVNAGFVYAYKEAAMAADNPEAAVMTMELARDYNKTDKEYLETLGDLYLEVGNPKGAVESYTAVSELDPQNQPIRKKIRDAAAVNTMQKGNWEEEGDFQNKLANKEEAAQLEQENKAVLSDDDITGMIKAFQLRVQSEPENISHSRRLAELYVQAGEFDAGIDEYERANSLTKGGDPEIDRAIVETTLKIYDNNIDYYENIEPNPEEAQQMRAEKEEYEFTIAADRVERYPNDREFKYLYGELLFKRGDYTEAIRQFQEGKKNPKHRLNAIYYLGRCFHAKGQLDMAINTLTDAADEMLVMDDTKKDVLYELGSISETMEEYAQALDYYKKIYEVDIGYKDVEQKIEEGYNRQQSS